MEYCCNVWAGAGAPSCYLELLDNLNWLNWFHFLILQGGLLVILIDCMIFSVTIPRCYRHVYVKTVKQLLCSHS